MELCVCGLSFWTLHTASQGYFEVGVGFTISEGDVANINNMSLFS
jgi:hypothetical protein